MFAKESTALDHLSKRLRSGFRKHVVQASSCHLPRLEQSLPRCEHGQNVISGKAKGRAASGHRESVRVLF